MVTQFSSQSTKKKSPREKILLKLQYGFYAIKLYICNKNSNIQDNGHMSDYKKYKKIFVYSVILSIWVGKWESVPMFGRL